MKKVFQVQNQKRFSKMAILLEIVRIGSITKAAEELNYTQSGLTYLLNTLEEDLGIPLLKRDHKGVSFTEEGLQLEPYIRSLVYKENQLREKVDELVGKANERIRIGAIHSIANHWLPQVIVKFKKDYPSALIEFRVGGGSEIPVWVKEGMIDIGIADQVHAEGFDWRPIMNDQFYVAVPISWNIHPKNGAILIDDLREHPMVFTSANLKNAGARAMKDIKQKFMISSADGITLLSMVESGLGFSLLSQQYLRDCPELVLMYPTDPPIFRRVVILANAFKSLRPLARKFVACMQKESESDDKH